MRRVGDLNRRVSTACLGFLHKRMVFFRFPTFPVYKCVFFLGFCGNFCLLIFPLNMCFYSIFHVFSDVFSAVCVSSNTWEHFFQWVPVGECEKTSVPRLYLQTNSNLLRIPAGHNRNR